MQLVESYVLSYRPKKQGHILCCATIHNCGRKVDLDRALCNCDVNIPMDYFRGLNSARKQILRQIDDDYVPKEDKALPQVA